MNDDIKELVINFYSQSVNDKNHRYKSWEHCYSYFLKNEINHNIDIACLHLAFYLASWGMYRGSSFLLWKDYLIHKEVVKEIAKHKDLQEVDFSIISASQTDKIFDLVGWIKNWYKENIKTVNGDKKEVNVTDTLVTKILLGTFGCIPAYDRYFVDGMRKAGISYSRLNKSNFESIIVFYKKHKQDFDDIQDVIYKKSNVRYPTMKLIDMYFWEIGFEADNQKRSHV